MKNLKVIFAFLAIYLGWGSTYLAIALALEDFSPFILAGIRFLLAGSVFLIWCRYQRVAFPPIRECIWHALVGILLLFFGSGSVIWVEQYLSTGLTSIIWASLPLWLIVLDQKAWHSNFTNGFLLMGLLLGFLGVVVLFWDVNLIEDPSPGRAPALLVAFVGVLAFSIGSLISRYRKSESNFILATSIQLLVAGSLALFSGLFVMNESFPDFSSQTYARSIFSLAYLVIIGSLVAYSAYVWLLKVMPPTVVSTYTYINPAVALLLGGLFLNEEITFLKIFSLALISTGVLTVNLKKSKRYDKSVKQETV